eukprot:jgi/Ulvmu1/6469/UM003_0100.1
MSSASSDYSEEYDEEASDDSLSDQDQPPGEEQAQKAATTRIAERSIPKRTGDQTGHDGTPFRVGLTDIQKAAVKQRRPVWDAIKADQRICLASANYNIYEKAPLYAFELLAASMGRFASRVTTATQTGDLVHHEDCQTLHIRTAEQACQAPANGLRRADPAATAQPSPASIAAPASTPAFIAAPSAGIPSLSTASGVLQPPAMLARMQASSACSPPDNPLLLAVVYLDTSHPDVEEGTMFEVHRRSRCTPSPGADVDASGGSTAPGQSAVAVWDLSRPQCPRALLLCQGRVRCCTFGPRTSGAVVVAGCADGAVCVWDTQAQPHHYSPASPGAASRAAGARSVPIYLPATTNAAIGLASTDAALVAAWPALDDAESIVGVEALAAWGTVQDGGVNAGNECCGGSSWQSAAVQPRATEFSVLALSASGNVSQWALRVSAAPGIAGSAGLGFAIDAPAGGAASLVCIRASIQHGLQQQQPASRSERAVHKVTPATALAVCTSRPGTFVIGTKAGAVSRGALHGSLCPQMYHLLEPPSWKEASKDQEEVCLAFEATAAIGTPVVGISVHPVLRNVFAVLLGMGCVAVFCTERRTPAGVWSCPAAAVAAVWLPGAPALLAVVCAAGSVTVCDVTMDACLQRTQCVAVELPGRCSCVAVAVSSMAGWGDGTAEICASESTQVPLGVLCLLLSDGSCIYHALGGYARQSAAADVHAHLISAT